MDLQHRLRPKTLVRPKWPDGRAGEIGYPSLFAGSGIVTRMLVEIACAEPVPLSQLPIIVGRDYGQYLNIQRRIIGQGLIRRYVDPRKPLRPWMALNREYVGYQHLRALLSEIGQANGKTILPDDALPLDLVPWPETITYETSAPVKTGRNLRTPFGNQDKPIFTLFGQPQRTKALLFVGSVESVDQSTLGRTIGIGEFCQVAQLMQALECDGIFTCELSGMFNMLRLADEPWTPHLRGLIATIVAHDENLDGLVKAVKISSVVGLQRKMERKKGVFRDLRRSR